MQTIMKSGVFLLAVLLVLAVGGCFASAAASHDTSKKTTTTSSTQGKTVQTAKQAKKSPNSRKNNGVLASAEQMQGTISFIGNSDKEVTLIGNNGTPYDFLVTSRTKIDLSGKKIAANELPGEQHKPATIRFVPTARGNMAQGLNISAS